MKCTVVREQILDAVTQVEKLTVKNHTLPVLACVLLEVKGDELFLTSTNLEVGLRFSVPVSDIEEGVVAVSGGVLSHVISSLPSGTKISLSTSTGYLTVSSSEGVSKLAVQEADDFPVLPEVSDGVEIEVPAKKFKEAITAVVYCASTSTIKPELSSVFVHVNNGTLVTAATDSFRLAEKKISLKKVVNTEPFLIPSKSTASLLRVLDKIEEDISIKTNNHQLSITLSNIYITLRLTTGSFPDYTQIIPKEFVTEATVLLFDFERVLRKASVFSDQFNQTTLTISPKNKKFTAHTKNDTIGETTDNVPAAISGEDLVINFNQRYLIDSLHSITSDSITLQFAGQSQPAVVKPVGNDGFLYLVMPMNR
jgi:DNA polymerase III subunit beta